MKHTKVVAFADDLILAVRSSTTRAVENLSNIETTKIINGRRTIRSASTRRSPNS
jgi:hypothetical protein